jgi:hypothetical protein
MMTFIACLAISNDLEFEGFDIQLPLTNIKKYSKLSKLIWSFNLHMQQHYTYELGF